MPDNTNISWFARQVKPRHEKTTAEALRSKGLEDFLPQYLAIRRWSDRIKRLEAPLFPRYVFCRFDLRNKLNVLTTPGVVSILGVGKTPVPIEKSIRHQGRPAFRERREGQPENRKLDNEMQPSVAVTLLRVEKRAGLHLP
jgi:transcription antitermination factor NusG